MLATEAGAYLLVSSVGPQQQTPPLSTPPKGVWAKVTTQAIVGGVELFLKLARSTNPVYYAGSGIKVMMLQSTG